MKNLPETSMCLYREMNRNCSGNESSIPTAQSDVVGQCTHRGFAWSNPRGGQGFHCTDDGLKISGTPDLAAQAGHGVAHHLSGSFVPGGGGSVLRIF